MIRNPLRKKLQAGQTAYGHWVAVESPDVTELAVRLGFDWVVVEMEHGHLDYREVMEHVRTVRGSETPVLVRVPEVQQSTIKRALDIGAPGVFLPLAPSERPVDWKGLDRGRQHLREHHAEPVCARELARLAGMSKSRARRRCSPSHGKNLPPSAARPGSRTSVISTRAFPP